MTPILDLSLLVIAILIYLALVATNKPKLKPLKGSKIIVKAKAKNLIIHIGLIDHFDGDVAVCYTEAGSMFAAWASHLFWSESEQAFIERV
jgi:hypothetical protein